MPMILVCHIKSGKRSTKDSLVFKGIRWRETNCVCGSWMQTWMKEDVKLWNDIPTLWVPSWSNLLIHCVSYIWGGSNLAFQEAWLLNSSIFRPMRSRSKGVSNAAIDSFWAVWTANYVGNGYHIGWCYSRLLIPTLSFYIYYLTWLRIYLGDYPFGGTIGIGLTQWQYTRISQGPSICSISQCVS